ncbi:TonB-dependent receptor [Spongiibacter sp. KMU-158]|uniref:TonB-dependent receptor n=1 Tax=Spongiibacter pelagi TaxID=2760804 RepID=A0A927C0M6_9GAMM|nr:TonB-dependent receptor [Spongiibacter pelagi]MBD2857857.1 TonB-dependent receptor [Spongiibacter pelagi]
MERNKRAVNKLRAITLAVAGLGFVGLAGAETPLLEVKTKRKPVESSAILEEVYVTARKREENLQETPVAVSAIGADALREAGIGSITDLQGAVPSLQFGQSGSKTPAIFIRGIGQREATSVLDPGVGVYLNGIFIARQDGQLLDTVDTQSIQVLRGPQGTLFGKNNTGGAILVTTKQPDPTEYSGGLMIDIGNYGREDVKLNGNIPLFDGKAGMRLVLNNRRLKGYFENTNGNSDFADEDRLSLSARLFWELRDDFSLDLFGFWSKQDERSVGMTCLFQNPDANIMQLRYPGQPEITNACRDSERAFSRSEYEMNQEHSEISMVNTMLALSLDWSISENYSLKSISAFSFQDGIHRNDDQDGTRVPALDSGTESLNRTLKADGKAVPQEERYQFSQELQLNGLAFNEKLNYTVGGFFSYEEISDNPFSQMVGPKGLAGVRLSYACGIGAEALGSICGLLDDTLILPLATIFANRSDLENESWAAFAQGTYSITDYLQLTLGARYTHEERKRSMTVYEVDALEFGTRIGAVYLDPVGLYSPITMFQFNNLATNQPDLPIIVNENADSGSAEWNNFTPSATLSMQAREDWLEKMKLESFMVYATYSEGFKAGGFEPKGPELVSFNPEEVVNYELGFKLDALNSRMRINAAAYMMDYEEIQVRVAEQGQRISDLFLYLSNAGKAQVNGAELETVFVLGNWFIQGSYSWTDASYEEFDANVIIPGQGEFIADRSDEPFALVPETSWSFSVAYNWLTQIGAFSSRLSAYYRSELFTGIDYLSDEFESSFIEEQTTWNFRLAWHPDENLNVTAYVNNLTDEQYFSSGFAVSALLGAATLVQGNPRSYGVQVGYQF